MSQRCSICLQVGHKRSAHDTFVSGTSRRKDEPQWYVAVMDRVGPGVRRWCGPFHWNEAAAVARFLDIDLPRRFVTRVSSFVPVAMRAENRIEVQDGWQSYRPVNIARSPRINPGHSAIARSKARAA